MKEGQSRKISYDKIIFLFVPLILCGLYLLKDLKGIWDIYLPAGLNGSWNDEVSYYKQIEGMVQYGIPQGYFGYNGLTAPIFTLGPWSPILLLPYAFIGKIIGWNYITPIICNILFLSIALAILAFGARISWNKQIAITIGLFCVNILIRYTVSGMIETLCCAIVITIAALIYICYKHDDNIVTIIWMCILITFFTWMRPYNVAYFLFPIYFFLKRVERKKLVLSVVGGLAIPTMALYGYFIIMRNFCSTQLFSFASMTGSFSKGDKENIFEGIITILTKYLDGLRAIAGSMKYGLIEEGIAGKIWFHLLAVSVILVVCIINDIRTKEKKMVIIDSLTLSMIVLIVSGMIMLSNVANVGFRHILAVLVFAIIMLLIMHDKKVVFATLLTLFIIGIGIKTEDYIDNVPYKTKENTIEVDERTNKFSEIMILQSGVSWNNTISWVYSDTIKEDTVRVDYAILYSIPKGFGFQLDDPEKYEQDFQNLKPKYLLVYPGGRADKVLKEYDAKVLLSADNYILYQNPNKVER